MEIINFIKKGIFAGIIMLAIIYVLTTLVYSLGLPSDKYFSNLLPSFVASIAVVVGSKIWEIK